MVYLTKYDHDLLVKYYDTPEMIMEPFPISPLGPMPIDDEVTPFKVYEDLISEQELIDLIDLLDHQKVKAKINKVGHGKII